jgi:diguanylate cyclase (GGDEF)-like protein
MLSYSKEGVIMNIIQSKLSIDTFILNSSSDVKSTLESIKKLEDNYKVIHILSFIHNTVLVQTLKKELEKFSFDSTISLLKHSDKSQTVVNIYSMKDQDSETDIEALILNEMHLNFLSQDASAQNCRNQLFSRYFTDHLTNLPNVYQLRKDIEESSDYGLVLIKIDNFITINNFYGFVIGDYVIEAIGKYLKDTISEHKVYRLSGAEFAFTMDKSMHFYELKIYLTELYEEIKNYSVNYQKSDIFVDFTMASTASNAHENIFSKVSMALNYAKEIGAPFWIYEDRMNFENDYERNLELSKVVRKGVKNSQIIPYFQAIVDNKTQKIVKFECLARLIDENNNVLSPILFIPIAKKIKVYNQITMQMINKSFAAFEENELEFNINLSIEDIMSSEIFHFILEKLKNSKASQRVTFELLESESIEDFIKVEKFINEVKRYGAKIAIDDFGSGYSNFSYLIKIKANYIKIDGSLIENIDVDKSALTVVETIVSFAKKLGMKTVAEYVHSSVIMQKVVELGIDYSQGFYIDKPSIEYDL